MIKILKKAEQGEIISDYETECVSKHGRCIPLSLTVSPVKDSEGNIVQVSTIARDIIERKRAEERLQASEAELQALLAAMNDVILVLDVQGRYLKVAPTNPLLLYKPPENLVGKILHDVFPVEQADMFLSHIRRVLETRQSINIEYSLPISGEEVWFIGTVSPMQEDSVLWVARNITERKQAEEKLRESEERFRSFVETTQEWIWSTDLRGIITYNNPAIEDILGYRSEEIVGKDALTFVHEEDRREIEETLPKFIAQRRGWDSLVLRWRHKDGTHRYLESNAVPIFDSRGELVGYRGADRDVTERRLAEESLKAYAARLNRSNRELQDFAYVASHDLQEPLRKVRTFGDRLKVKYAEALGEQGRDYLERMEGAAVRMQDLINGLLELSQVTIQAQPFAPVNLNDVVHDVLFDLEVRIEQVGGRVEVGKLPTVEADRLQMHQLLQNLIVNALKFHQEETPPAVKVHGRLLEERKEELSGDPEDTRVWQILVEDNGIGFDEKHLDRIFVPFERLHNRVAYEGTGMGLAICRKVLERHGGEITARSAPGQGAMFVVTLPIKQLKKRPRGRERRS